MDNRWQLNKPSSRLALPRRWSTAGGFQFTLSARSTSFILKFPMFNLCCLCRSSFCTYLAIKCHVQYFNILERNSNSPCLYRSETRNFISHRHILSVHTCRHETSKQQQKRPNHFHIEHEFDFVCNGRNMTGRLRGELRTVCWWQKQTIWYLVRLSSHFYRSFWCSHVHRIRKRIPRMTETLRLFFEIWLIGKLSESLHRKTGQVWY